MATLDKDRPFHSRRHVTYVALARRVDQWWLRGDASSPRHY